jgi:hypothetical protein
MPVMEVHPILQSDISWGMINGLELHGHEELIEIWTLRSIKFRGNVLEFCQNQC